MATSQENKQCWLKRFLRVGVLVAAILTSLNLYIVYSVVSSDNTAEAMQTTTELKESMNRLEQAKISLAK